MKRTETAKQNNQKWFHGQAFAMSKDDPEFQEIARNFLCGDVLLFGILSDQQKALITLTALTTCQTLLSIGTYTLAALEVRVKPVEIKETLYQCGPYIGLEKVQCALAEVNEAFHKAGIATESEKQASVTEENRFEKGLAVQQEIFGEENINAMRAAAPEELKHIQD